MESGMDPSPSPSQASRSDQQPLHAMNKFHLQCAPEFLTQSSISSHISNSKKSRNIVIISVLLCTLFSLLILVFLYNNDIFKIKPSSSSQIMLQTHPCKYHQTHTDDRSNSVHHFRHVILIDAGSQGTRMHIYELEFCNEVLIAIHKDLFVSVPVSLHSFANTPSPALIGAKVIDPLLLRAVQLIPENEHASTPIALRATAGVRLLPIDKVKSLLQGCKRALSKYPFLLVEGQKPSVELITGTSEGIWAWISTNFLYKSLRRRCDCANATVESDITLLSTISVIDLGGASLQIISEISEDEAQLIARIDARLISEVQNIQLQDLVHPIKFQGKDYLLFVHSFLNYGYQTTRSLVTLSVVNQVLGSSFTTLLTPETVLPEEEASSAGKSFPAIVPHPCYTFTLQEPMTIVLSQAASNFNMAYVNITASPVSSWDKCCAAVSSILDTNRCNYPQCSFEGIPLPKSMFRRPNETINLSSHFTAVLGPLLDLLPKYGQSNLFWGYSPRGRINKDANNTNFEYKDISIKDIEKMGKIICSPLFTPTRYPDIFEAYKNSPPPILPNLCLDLSYIYMIMTEAFRLPKSGPGSILRVEMEQIGGAFPCWTLGAAMSLFHVEKY